MFENKIEKVKQLGKYYICLCPFHQEKTPSFCIDTISKKYHCFGCGEDGDATELLKFIEENNLLNA
jgi:DNA primase